MRELISAEIDVRLARRGLNYTALARMLEVQQQWLSRRFTGEVTFSIDDVEAIARVLHIDPLDLIVAAYAHQEEVALDRRRQVKRSSTCSGPLRIVPVPRPFLAVA